MTGILVVAILAIVYIVYLNKENKFQELERQQELRRAVLKLNEKHQDLSH